MGKAENLNLLVEQEVPMLSGALIRFHTAASGS